MLTFLQLSDIHLSGLPDDSPRDLDRKLRHRLRKDAVRAAEKLGGISGVLISGDVAFSGTEAQYRQASGWLRDLCVRLDVDPSDVWAIPGNHDIQRDETRSPEQRVLRSRFRMEGISVDAEFDGVFEDPARAARLIAPLANYNKFAAQFGCEISADSPFWTDDLPLGNGIQLFIRGMSSPLISDEHDDTDRGGLALGTMQTTVLAEDDEVYISMCHHPYSWLLDGDAARRVIDGQIALHITGHEHTHDVRETARGFHLCTGALQSERSGEEWEPRYNFVSRILRPNASSHTSGCWATGRWK